MVKALAAFRGGPTPLPNNGAAPGTLNYVVNNYLITNGTEIRPNTKISVKGDHNFSAKSRISGYWGYNRSSQKPGANGPAGLPGLLRQLQRFAAQFGRFPRHLGLSPFRPTMFNHFYGGGNNWKENHDPPQATVVSGIHWKDKVCVGNVPDCDQNLVKFTFSNGYSQWGGDANNGSENLIKSLPTTSPSSRGRHTLKFGRPAQLAYYNGFGRQCVAGCISFDFKTYRASRRYQLHHGRRQSRWHPCCSDTPTAGSIDTIRYIGQQWPSFSGFVAGRLAHAPEPDGEPRPALGDHAAADGRERQLERLRSEPAQPRRGRTEGCPDLCRQRNGLRRIRAGWPTATSRRSGRASAWPGRCLRKTVIRTSYSLSYANITTVTGSTHTLGFTLTDTQSDSTNGLQPRFLVKDGRPPYAAPPFVDPSFGNGRAMPWFQGQEATRPPAYQSFNLSIQHQITPTTVGEISYNGSLGSRLQAGLLQYNALDPKYLTQYGATLLNSRIDSAAAVAAGLKSPFPGFIASLGIERHGAPGAASLSAVPGNRYRGGRRRSQRPLHVSRRHDPL